ncbi:hypothetical protein CR205_04345 [Alteribacter lacisalsi]|uniref:Thioredoxin domain-containing protein n=1 Tax=Alteribacter lacisalsi TaxID=2045244 RepID=A0A2W0HD09_9BACI|nr:thioredoxin family protein [Alteribacter lacisalsi]PYZ97830.1 hypothetical protein CR205_04345 [Alteribacter lacisalsi]
MIRTKAFLLSVLLAALWMCTGCQSDRTSADHSLLGEEDETVTVLFSDETQAVEEAEYYEAVVDLHRNYSDQVLPVKVVHADEDNLVSSYEVNSFPTLLIIEDNRVIKRIEGELSTEQILNELKTGLQLNRVNEDKKGLTVNNNNG